MERWQPWGCLAVVRVGGLCITPDTEGHVQTCFCLVLGVRATTQAASWDLGLSCFQFTDHQNRFAANSLGCWWMILLYNCSKSGKVSSFFYVGAC